MSSELYNASANKTASVQHHTASGHHSAARLLFAAERRSNVRFAVLVEAGRLILSARSSSSVVTRRSKQILKRGLF